jgi:hypothetical protein
VCVRERAGAYVRVGLLIQYVTRRRHIFCVPFRCIIFFDIKQTARFSGKKDTEHKMCFDFSLQPSFETFLILRRNKRDIVINVYTSSCKVRVIFFVGF